ncbi:MAG: IclR family transcriptional regulator [Ardenticatenaceae bacterium]
MSRVQSVERAFIILNVLASHPKGISITRLAERVDLPVSTVSRLLLTLESLRAVEHIGNREGYRIGTGIIDLATRASFPEYLIKQARPTLKKLAKRTGETVTLSVPDGKQTLCLDEVPGNHHLQTQNWVNRHYPLHLSSDGKLILAAWSPDELELYLADDLDCPTPASLCEPQRLREAIADAKDKQHAWAWEEFEVGIVDVAAAIRDANEQIVATIGISGPSFRFPPQGQKEKIAQMIVEAAQQISDTIQNNR